jgi:hypothetical protein
LKFVALTGGSEPGNYERLERVIVHGQLSPNCAKLRGASAGSGSQKRCSKTTFPRSKLTRIQRNHKFEPSGGVSCSFAGSSKFSIRKMHIYCCTLKLKSGP